MTTTETHASPTLKAWLGVHDKNCRGVEVTGHSMSAAGIVPGDYVVIDTSREPYTGCVVAAEIPGHGCSLRRYYGSVLYSDSLLGPGEPVETFSVVGVVVCHLRGEQRLRDREPERTPHDTTDDAQELFDLDAQLHGLEAIATQGDSEALRSVAVLTRNIRARLGDVAARLAG